MTGPFLVHAYIPQYLITRVTDKEIETLAMVSMIYLSLIQNSRYYDSEQEKIGENRGNTLIGRGMHSPSAFF